MRSSRRMGFTKENEEEELGRGEEEPSSGFRAIGEP